MKLENSTDTRYLELLAPAGDWDSLKAAVAAGADAVYLGGRSFSARQLAPNFDQEQLQRAADLLHLQGKKIYVAVNTLINDAELAAALEYLAELWQLGADAVIIQDLGLINLARRYLPQLELHASTQMTVHNSAGAIFLKRLGLKRVVLARELTQAEVATISDQSGLAVEVFVHGALCVCYSGQCLLSSLIGGRSGNRGRCAQPCRLPYQLLRAGVAVPTAGSYLLSPMDLALAGLIPQLHQAGVTALKIEGRMKQAEYVYNVVKVYRGLLDRYYQNPSEFEVLTAEWQRLEAAFNRGFSSGYFGGNRNQTIINWQRPNNRGLFLGRVLATTPPQRVSLALEAELGLEDQVEFWISQGGRRVATVAELQDGSGQAVKQAPAGSRVSFKSPGKIRPGDRAFKVFSAQAKQELQSILDPKGEAVKIPCSLRVSGRRGEPLRVTYQDNRGHQGQADTTLSLEPARNRPLTSEVLREQLGRLGETPFYLTQLESELEPGLMLPLSELNQVRRQALADLIAVSLRPWRQRVAEKPQFKTAPPHPTGAKPNELSPPVLSAWVADPDALEQAARNGADYLYLAGDQLGPWEWDRKTLSEAIDLAQEYGSQLVVALPRINRPGQQNLGQPLLEMALELPAAGVLLSDLGSLELVRARGGKALFLNYPLNFFNHQAVQSLAWPEVCQITLAPELTLAQIRLLRQLQPEPRLECLVHGPLELMVSEYCPIGAATQETETCQSLSCRHDRWELRDRLGLDFPVIPDQFCRMHLLNTVDLCLYQNLAELIRIPNLCWRLDLRIYPPPVVGAIVAAYHTARQNLLAGEPPVDSNPVINEFKRLTGRGITRGHYFRGV